MKIEDILAEIDYITYQGDKDMVVNKIVPLENINFQNDSISWCSDRNINALEKLQTSSIVIISHMAYKNHPKRLNYLVVENPRRTFQEILIKFFVKQREINISDSAIIHPSTIIGKNVFIGHNVVIEEECMIGDNCVILHNTVILNETQIGNNVVIGSNNTIGGVGFGYEKNEKGDFELIPHIGNVIIKDNVDIGNNTCIDRAVLGSTILEENVKVDNLVHIAHGVKVGRNSVVIANAMVAGSVNIGENSWIAPSSSILNKKSIGDNALVGMGAVVTKNVDSNTIVAGNPSKFIRNIER